jgi:hypothetical protein
MFFYTEDHTHLPGRFVREIDNKTADTVGSLSHCDVQKIVETATAQISQFELDKTGLKVEIRLQVFLSLSATSAGPSRVQYFMASSHECHG